MSILNFLKLKETSHGWREAASKSGYGIKADIPDFPKDLQLVTHLNVSEKSREKLQAFIIKHWNERPEHLVDGFLNIAVFDKVEIHFPDEIEKIARSRYKREPSPDSLRKKIAAIYIGHEKNVWLDQEKLKRAQDIGCKRVKIRTSEDARVCLAYRKHANKIYSISKAPKLPACLDCRCYYEPQI